MTTSAISALLQQGARADLLKMKAQAKPGLVDLLCEKLPSNVRTEYLPFLGQAPVLTKHDLGEMLTTSQLSDVSFSVENETFRAAIKVFSQDLEDDQTMGVRMRIQQMIRMGMRLDEKLVVDAIEGSQVGYDGVSMFNNTHPARGDSGAQDNLLAGAGVSTANIQADIAAGIAAIAGFNGENGDPINEGGLDEFVLLAPHGIRQPVMEALFGQYNAVTSQAMVEGLKITPYFSGRLSDANDWYLFCTGLQKPFYFFDRKPLTVYSSDENSDTFIKEGAYIFSVERRAKCANGHWAHAVKFVNS